MLNIAELRSQPEAPPPGRAKILHRWTSADAPEEPPWTRQNLAQVNLRRHMHLNIELGGERGDLSGLMGTAIVAVALYLYIHLCKILSINRFKKQEWGAGRVRVGLGPTLQEWGTGRCRHGQHGIDGHRVQMPGRC